MVVVQPWRLASAAVRAYWAVSPGSQVKAARVKRSGATAGELITEAKTCLFNRTVFD